MSTFLPAMCAAFFILVRPASRNAKPACMNITSTAATTTQIGVDFDDEVGGLHVTSNSPRRKPCAVVNDVLDPEWFNDPVA